MKIALFTAILLGWMCVGESDDRHSGCCLTVSNTRIPVQSIVDYYMQESRGLCAVRAVRFRTTKNKIICSDPEGSWAKRAINVVNERRTLTEEPSEEPDVYDGVTANLITTTTETTTAIQTTSTEDGLPATCCLKLGSIRVPLEKVLNYRIQTRGLCPITAVVIQTVSGRILCSDPNSNWTQRAMRKVDKGREQDPVPAEGASADGSRGRADPDTTTELPLSRTLKRVKPGQKCKKEKSKTGTKAHKGPKEKKSERGGVKGKKKKGKNCAKTI